MDWWQVVQGTPTRALPEVAGITLDSRKIKPGWAFAAVPGGAVDGHDYLDAAIAGGATALVVQNDRREKWQHLRARLPLLIVDSTRSSIGPLASAVYGNPSRKLRVVGVTGTDGKTTSSHLTAYVLDRCGLKSGYLTSVGFDAGEGFELNDTHMTTVESPVIHNTMARALLNGKETMIVESSSEGLAQHRLDGTDFDVAVFTNLSRDHLDFHGTMENYLAAKGLVFMLASRSPDKGFPKAAVLNADDRSTDYLSELTTLPAVTYGTMVGTDLQATEIVAEGFCLRFTLRCDGINTHAQVPLIGRFNVYNSLIAVAVARSQGVEVPEAVAALSSFPGVPGRLERIDEGQPFSVYVDIASTPAALENVLTALRPGTQGKLWVLFGAAGGRDPARRDGMGRIAGKLADAAVITNEDPRLEDPEAIIEAIAAGLKEGGMKENEQFFRRLDRTEAIEYIFSQAQPGDTVLLAGKATETSMVFGTNSVPWDERATARRLLGASVTSA
jgi:UDP-N-acetylmuramoyl-L-alanyl-D-glutamate--2,6-diaminopimelate ligase